jgi:hypothetical protein
VRVGRAIGLATAAGFVGFVAYSLLWSEPVKVLHPKLQYSAARAFVSGAVENTGSAEESVSLEVRYYNEAGRQVASDTVQIDNLGSGATRDFKLPDRLLPAGSSYSIYLNHGRNPYGN